MVRRALLAAAALIAGLAVAAGLLVYDRTGQSAVEVYAATTDLPAGAVLAGGAVRLVATGLGGRQAALAYRSGEGARLALTEAGHDLTAGQIIQRSDTRLAGRDNQRALVVVPLKDAPPLHPGDRVNLLYVTGTGEATTVSLFAAAVEVHSATGTGAVLDVGARQAPGFVYAAAALHLVAVQVAGSVRAADEVPVASSQQALAVVRR